VSKFSEWECKPEHVKDFHIGAALAYRDLGWILTKAAKLAPADEFTEEQRAVLERFMVEGLDDRYWATPSRPQDF